MGLKSSKKIWSGGLSDESGPDLSGVLSTEDNKVDGHLVRYELLSLIAYHTELSKQGITSPHKFSGIMGALLDLYSKPPMMSNEFEDVHSMVQAKMGEKTNLSGDLRIFLSRNDQVHTDIRMFYTDVLLDLSRQLLECAVSLKDNTKVVSGYMAGHTHYRQAMPVSFSTYFDHVSALLLELAESASRLSSHFTGDCPLGYGSGFGSPVPVEMDRVAVMLGFEHCFSNPLTGSSKRGSDDLEVAMLNARVFTSLSRIAQDLILFSSDEFGFIKLGKGYTTGSSLMPNKRNPDLLEMIQGYASEALGIVTTSLSVMMNKGSGYHREFQLSKDKVMTFSAQSPDILGAFAGLLGTIRIDASHAEDMVLNSTHATMDAYDAYSSGMDWKEAYTSTGEKLKAGRQISKHPPRDYSSTTKEMILKKMAEVDTIKEGRERIFLSVIDDAKSQLKQVT